MMRANGRAYQINQELGLAAVGGSDAHVKEALGWAHTVFTGRNAEDLRASILARTTEPGARRAGFVGLGRYLAWQFGPPRRPPLPVWTPPESKRPTATER